MDQNMSYPTVEQTLQQQEKLLQNYQTNELVNYNIIQQNDQDIIYIKQAIEQLKFSTLKEEKSIACLVGSSIGDSLGALAEGNNFQKDRKSITSFESYNELQQKKYEYGQYTDDTAMALCIADSLIINNLQFNDIDIRHRFILWWYKGYNNGLKNAQGDQLSKGIGQRTYKSFFQFFQTKQGKVQIEQDFSKQNNHNGGIMRIAPIPIAFQDNIEKGMEYAEYQSYCTHNGEEVADCARLLAYLAIKLINSQSINNENLKQILDNLGKEFKAKTQAIDCIAKSKQEDNFEKYKNCIDYNQSLQDRNWNWKSTSFDYSPYRLIKHNNIIGVYSCDCTAMALHILYNTFSYKEAILKAINLGGDADTLGAITGYLAGSYYGFDNQMKFFYQYLQRWDENMIAVKAYKLYLLNNKYNIIKKNYND